MKSLLLSFALILGISLVKAQEAPVKKSDAVMTFETEEHDFGTIKEGGNGVYEFVFKNTGKEPLIINSAQGSCGCTVPIWPKEPIAPGAKAKIKVSYDTKRVGPFEKTVTISTNETNGTRIIKIKGTVVAAPKEQTSPFKNNNNTGSPFEN